MAQRAELTVFWHPVMLEHKPPDGAFKFPSPDFLAVEEPHPERPERIENIKGMITSVLNTHTNLVQVDAATQSEIASVHKSEYINQVRSFSESGGGRIEDTTTGGNGATFDAARHASGAAVEAVKMAHRTESHIVPYALVRPPGHHAQSDQADGFCFFNHTAVAAEQALNIEEVNSIAIVDWDVHHGNGTQEIFYDRADVLPISIHTDHGSWHSEFHPQTGSIEEDGVSDGKGYTVNIPVPPAIGNEGYERVLDTLVEPIIAEYEPDMIVVGAGQDAGIADPNARNMIDRFGFRDIAGKVRSYAHSYANENLAVIQEGGYQTSHLPFATLGVLEGVLDITVNLSEHGYDEDPFTWLEELDKPTKEWIEQARSYHASHWPV